MAQSADRSVLVLRRWHHPDLDQLDAVIVDVIRRHEGLPCPTRRTLREWTGMPWRRVWRYLDDMQARGLIEIEVCAPPGQDPRRRRMRVAGGTWTEWTARTRVGDVGAS